MHLIVAEVEGFEANSPPWKRNSEGVVEEWSVEGGGPNSLSRQGWRPSTFKPGDTVTVRVNPMRDGSAAGEFVAAKFSDGKTLGRWN